VGCVKHFLLVSLSLFPIQPRTFSAVNSDGATLAVSSKDCSPPEQIFMNEILHRQPAELRAVPDLLRETPIRTNPEAPAMAQPDTPRQKLGFPAEIQAPGWFCLTPPNGHYKPQTTKEQRSCSSAESLGDFPLPGEPGLKLLVPSHSARLGMGISNR